MDDTIYFFGGWQPVLRIMVVGTAAYIALILILRASGARTLAQMNAFDFLVTVAIGASFGRVLTARGVSLAEAVAAFVLLVALQYIVSWLKTRSPRFESAITSPPTMLYYRGAFQRDAMRRVRVTESELRTAVRQQGTGTLQDVEAIVLEANGQFAVIGSQVAGDGSVLPTQRA